MSGRSSRTKGSAAEREVVAILKEAGYDVRRCPYSGALEWMKGDIVGAPWHVEVKRCEALRIPEWMRKLREQAEDKPGVLIFRRSREEWNVCLTLEDFLGLMEGE